MMPVLLVHCYVEAEVFLSFYFIYKKKKNGGGGGCQLLISFQFEE